MASFKLQVPTNARIANRGNSQPYKTHKLAMSVLGVILPTTNGWIGAKRAQEVLLVFRTEPTMPAKAVVIAPVVPIPKWKLCRLMSSVKAAQKVNEVCFTLHTSCFNVKENLNVT